MNWPDLPPDDAAGLRRALDRAEAAVRAFIGAEPGRYYRSNESPTGVRLVDVIQVAVEGALEATDVSGPDGVLSSSEHHDRILHDPDYRERWFNDLARTVAVDFDGVLHPYTEGWVGPEPADEEPIPGAVEFLTVLVGDGYRVVVFSTRCDTDEGLEGTRLWLAKRGLDSLISDVTCRKPAAIAYVDDRAVSYRDGNWPEVLSEIDRLAEGHPHGAAR